MRISLRQEEVEAALKGYIAERGISLSVENVNFTAGRNGAGMTADIDLTDLIADASEPLVDVPKATVAPIKRTRKTATKAEPVVEVVVDPTEQEEDVITASDAAEEAEATPGEETKDSKSLFG